MHQCATYKNWRKKNQINCALNAIILWVRTHTHIWNENKQKIKREKKNFMLRAHNLGQMHFPTLAIHFKWDWKCYLSKILNLDNLSMYDFCDGITHTHTHNGQTLIFLATFSRIQNCDLNLSTLIGLHSHKFWIITHFRIKHTHTHILLSN